MRTIWKGTFLSSSPPAATHVQSTTSAPASAGGPPKLSSRYLCRSGRTASGRPTRTTPTPSLAREARMLSTATFESAVARTGLTPSARTHSVRICTATVVLPVPGGPCTSVSRRVSAASTAARCESLRVACERRARALTRASSAARPVGVVAIRTSSALSCAPSRPPMLARSGPISGVTMVPRLQRSAAASSCRLCVMSEISAASEAPPRACSASCSSMPSSWARW
mmetsp:Transcript_46890/g.153529  ORF Transcript_46890/g.153529 Transcript_46890/m.153529 type:complete len:226 (+) Transcript_46890:1010-1687(+)